jgi:tRNA A-37 threonylcarbamoyl transferase component Bud32
MNAMGNTREAVVKTGDVVEGRYRIIKTLGAGGMGTVFLAEHALIKRRVAIKILHHDLATDANVVERFMNEARAAGTLGHPNIVESTDMGFTHDHVPYIVYEYLEGTLLTDEIYRVGGLPVRRAVRVAEQIASALTAAHNASIVHRDLKSDNIFLTDKDDALDIVKVLDFGVARFLELDDRQRNMIMGTPEFMAPEQIVSPESVDKRADIYALGVILYEMLTARRPFSNDDDPRQLMHRIVNEEPPPMMRPEVPHALCSIIVDKLLAKDPADRYQSMADVAAALEQFSTRGDAPARRRSQPIAVVSPASEFDATPETSIRLPKPVPVRDTPWPVDTLDGTTPLAIGQVSLPAAPPARRPYALYGVAAAGILMGAAGLLFGLKGGNDAPQAQAQVQPMPAATIPQQPAEPIKPEKIEVKLTANVENARVVFRRRVADVPVKMEINATDVVELVEVSAPGYKTTRYWLTFDRPTYLTAELVKGTGSIEATEEETLVALGEVIMVKDSRVAAAAEPVTQPAAAPVAPTVATTTPPVKVVDKAADKAPNKVSVAAAEPKLAPRKIGRGDETTSSVVASTSVGAKASETPVPAPIAPPTPAVAMVDTHEPATKAEPVAKAQPAPAKIEAADKTLPTPVTVQDAPKTELVAAKTEPAVARPLIDNATVSSVISTHRPEVLKCFAEGKKKNAAMKGTISVQLQVEPSGKVHRVQVQSTLGAPLVAACVVRAANAWKFPSRSGSEVATVSYPFTLN